ncbi:MAG: D-alanine--D-alanine ligase family protein [Bacillota bacterium]
MAKLRVALIFGGRSKEHEISLLSAQSIIKALDQDRYEVIPIGITKDGRWLRADAAMRALQEPAPPAMRALAEQLAGDQGAPVALVRHRAEEALVDLESGAAGPIDVAFPVLHGPFGEDGTVQGLLELAGIPYVGAGVTASAVGMDKALQKQIFRQAGLPVVDFLAVKRREIEADVGAVVRRIEAAFTYPLFVKPVNLGSSVGIHKAKDTASLQEALVDASRYDRRVLIEAFAADCREIECSVLGNDDPIASVPGEIIPCREFYDYTAKYIEEGSELVIPADLPAELAGRVRDLATGAYLALDCAGMARVDFFVGREGRRVYVNEVNTIPGFTKISMYPKLWEASGLSYPALVDRLIELALERHQDKARNE